MPSPPRRWRWVSRKAVVGLCTLLLSCGGDGKPANSTTSNNSLNPERSAGAELRRNALTNTTVIVNSVPRPNADASANDPATPAHFALVGVAVDAAGNLYLTQRDKTIRKLTPQGTLSMHAGGASVATKPADSLGVAADEAGNVHIIDRENCSMRRITPDGRVTTTTLPASSPGTPCSAMQASPEPASAAMISRN